jgi:splicing factor U2AF subunit
VNSYSSSRDYRAREREDRYSGGRRDDREWDRGNRAERGDRAERGGGERGGGDRGDRRRRDVDDRPRRDLFDGRRGGRGGGDRGDRADRGDRGDRERRERERKRSATPPRRKEPTPDLTDVPSVLTRKRRLTQWDIKPPGYENVTAEQAKISGMYSKIVS